MVPRQRTTRLRRNLCGQAPLSADGTSTAVEFYSARIINSSQAGPDINEYGSSAVMNCLSGNVAWIIRSSSFQAMNISVSCLHYLGCFNTEVTVVNSADRHPIEWPLYYLFGL